MKTNTKLLSNKRGSAIVAIFVITTSLVVMLGAILSHSITERRINGRHELRLEAKNASEAIAEYAFAQLKHKFQHRTNFTSTALSPSTGDGLNMPVATIFGSKMDYANSAVVGGAVPDYPTTLSYIDPDNSANEFDPLRGQKVYTRRIGIYAKATVKDDRGGPSITNYVSQKLQIRDAPLFAHAIFYNLDLEISPGPKMEIHGPVHTNGDLYAQAISGVDFHYPTSTAGNMYYGWATNVSSAKGAGYESLQVGDVKFKNRQGNLVSFKDNGTYMDSDYSHWREYASNRWNGYLLTKEHGVEFYTPVAFPDYAPDNPATSEYDPNNSGLAMIQPALSSSHPDYDEKIEEQKMATKAGIRFTWDANTSVVKAYRRNGIELDISALQGSGWDNLWEVKTEQFLDHRRNSYITVVDFNVGKLKQLIETPNTSDSNDHIGNYDPDDMSAYFNPATEWNGIVYFEVTSSATDSDLEEHLNYSGIRLWGGETDVLHQGIPSRGQDPGMTFASNDAVYISGHFNADGYLNATNTANNSAIIPEQDEVPVAIFGDSVTILSKDWSDSNYSKNPSAGSTEVAVAIVSGLIPTNADNNGRSSGGVHNFPRFLENWGGKELFIRGSLVCLYESEIDDSPWRIDYYSPPARNWGFSKLFLDGTYPPGTPLLRTYRRIDYTNLTESEYDAAIAALPWSDEITNNTGGGGSVIEEVIDETIEDPEVVDTDPPADPDEDIVVVVDEDDDEPADTNPGNGWGDWGWWWWPR